MDVSDGLLAIRQIDDRVVLESLNVAPTYRGNDTDDRYPSFDCARASALVGQSQPFADGIARADKSCGLFIDNRGFRTLSPIRPAKCSTAVYRHVQRVEVVGANENHGYLRREAPGVVADFRGKLLALDDQFPALTSRERKVTRDSNVL